MATPQEVRIAMSSHSISEDAHGHTYGPTVNHETQPIHNGLTELSIISWNIHDLMTCKEGPKTEDPDFADIITKSSIFCLQETKQEFFIPNYECFNSNRPKSRSGGICLGIHRSISSQTRVIKTGCPDFQAVTIFPHDETSKFTIINVYDSPENSSYKAKARNGQNSSGPVATTLDLILEFRAKNHDLGEILLVGDLNARTGNLNPVFEADDLDLDDAIGENHKPPSYPEHLPDRSSRDGVVNARGKLLTDFLACTKLTILNGCVLGDVFGEFTSVNYNGCSVVDYMTATPNLYGKVSTFEVLSLTKFSDHKPLTCKVKASASTVDADVLLEALEDAPRKYKWDHDDESTHFRFLAVQNQADYREKILNLSKTVCRNKTDVANLNKSLVTVFQEMADKLTGRESRGRKIASSAQTNRKKLRIRPKSTWFDADCIISKRELNRFAKSYGEDPTNQIKREHYYGKRRTYRRLIKNKKEEFLTKLCQDIEEGKNVNWSRFKKLKDMKNKGQTLDVYDMKNFCIFFAKLYGKPTLDEEKIMSLKSGMERQQIQSDLEDILDKHITVEEINAAISSTKKRKAVAEDLISNELLKSSGKLLRLAILNVFNQCLDTGTYPWHASVVTPLHKKGSIYDPNNYRAIAVASNLGKLFASILLKRLITFRSECNPDTPNQLGFCQNAMTSDHIYTLSTCIEKYVSFHKKRLYSCFVDYAKAFDTVCREALLYKLWKLGIQGKFFNCLQDMYTNSAAKIKLLNKLSEEIDVLCGTEQGHPMSPELFKCFVHQLSEELNNLDDVEVPVLNSEYITHLLWADDLVLLALTPLSLQKMLNTLHSYCLEWGLSVNINKTAVMVFNRSGRLLNESNYFLYGETPITSAREYTYLGVVFTLSGSFKIAQANLRQRALRGYFSLKSMINLNHIKKTIVFKLFDALILPVASYGCQAWLPYTNIIKGLVKNGELTLSNVAQDPLERVHLSFLKWTMGVNKFTSNTAVWGDTGSYQLAIELSAQVLRFYERLEQTDTDGNPAFVRHAFAEQKILSLSWYSNIKEGLSKLEKVVGQTCPIYDDLRESLSEAARACLPNDLTALFTDQKYTLEVAKMVTGIDCRRFPINTTRNQQPKTKRTH